LISKTWPQTRHRPLSSLSPANCVKTFSSKLTTRREPRGLLANTKQTSKNGLTLKEVHVDIGDDVDYAKEKWLRALQTQREQREQARNRRGRICQRKGGESIWHTTREGTVPWLRVHRKLYIMNRSWWHELGGCDELQAKYKKLFREGDVSEPETSIGFRTSLTLMCPA
jgi:hypothetical protein